MKEVWKYIRGFFVFLWPRKAQWKRLCNSESPRGWFDVVIYHDTKEVLIAFCEDDEIDKSFVLSFEQFEDLIAHIKSLGARHYSEINTLR